MPASRALPPFRIGENDDNDLHVVRGGRYQGDTAQPPAWGPPPVGFSDLLLCRWAHFPSGGTSGTTFVSEGSPAPTINTPGLAALADTTAAFPMIRLGTTTTANSDAGIIGAINMQTRHGLHVAGAIMPRNAITSARYWLGLFSATPMASATPAVHLAGFRYDTSAGDTRWRCLTDNGGGTPTEPTLIATPPAIALNVPFRFVIRARPGGGQIEFWGSNASRYENGGALTLYAVATTDVPTASTNLALFAQVRTLNTTAKQIAIAKVAGAWS